MSSWEEYKKKKQKNKNISTNTNSTNQVVTPTTNTTNWNNVINRANQMLANTRNVNNLVSMQNPLIMKPQDNLISDEQAKNIASIDDSKKRFEAVSRISKNKKQLVQNNLQVNKIRENEKSKKEAEKINKDISQGNYMSSVGHVLKGLPKEALNSVTKTTLSLANLNPNTKDSKEMMEAGKLLTNRYSDTTSQINNKIVQGASRVSGTIGNMIPSIATGLMGGPAGLVNAINVGGSSYMENLNEEQDNKLKSLLTGTVKGTLSYNIEKLAGGNFLGKGSLDDLTKMGISKVKSDIGKRIASKLYEVGGEIAEENLENITGYVVDKLINDKDITMEQFISDLKQTSGDTAITTLVLSALGLGGDTYNQSKINEVIDNSSLSNEQKSALKNVIEKDKASLEEVQALIDRTSKNQSATMQNNEILNNNKQVIQQTQQTAQNQTSQETLGNSKYSIKMPNSNYKFTKSGNEKVDNLRQDANKYWNNSEDTQKLMTTLEKVMNDKDVSIRIDDSITDEQGNILDGKYQNGVITINPNSSKAIEYVATHELTHAIGTKEMLDMVQKYRESNSEFNSKVETLLKNYNKSELTEEALADVSAQLFGTQEFIANVQNTNPNLFQRIYNEIKYLWHQFRGYKNEGQFIDDLYNKWTKAYNSNAELNQTTKNMIAGRIAMNNAVSQNAQFKVIEDAYNKALQMANRKIDNETIRKQTNWFKDKNGHWKFRITDKDMTLRKDVNHIMTNREYALEDMIKHDILFVMYPQLTKNTKNPIKVEFKKMGKNQRGAYFDKSKTIRINSRLLELRGAKRYIEETLIHEIQHAVQNIEGFEHGTSMKKGFEKYINSLGEIEAKDTEKTFYKEKYLNKNITNAPESSKANPKPLDLKKPNIFDKIFSSINNFFEEENASYEENIEILEESDRQDSERNRTLVDGRIKDNEGLEESSSFNLPESNQETRYSKQNSEWHEYVENTFRPKGTTTKKEQIRLPEKKVKDESKEDLIKAFREETENIDVISTEDQIKAIQNLDTKQLDKKLPDTSTMIVNKLTKDKIGFKDFVTQIRKYVTNKGVAVDELFKKTGNKQGTWKYDRYLGSFSEGQTSIGVRQVNSKGEVVGDSLLNIYEKAKKDGITQKILDDYVLNKDNIARSNYEKGLYGESVTSKDSQAIIDEYDKKYPQLKEHAKELTEYANNNTKSYLVGNFISEDLYNKIREMYPDHIPVVRDITETPRNG